MNNSVNGTYLIDDFFRYYLVTGHVNRLAAKKLIASVVDEQLVLARQKRNNRNGNRIHQPAQGEEITRV